jgi:excisionase family DNA binding protein
MSKKQIPTQIPPDNIHGRMLRVEEVAKKLGIHRATLNRYIAAGTFPRGHYLWGSPKLGRWREEDIDDWIERTTHQK